MFDNEVHFSVFFEKMQDACINNESLYKKLKELTIPRENSNVEDWDRFTQKLCQIMQQERDIGHEWNFSTEEIDCLTYYLQANKLLLDCLNLASVSDRQGIEDRLFLPLE